MRFSYTSEFGISFSRLSNSVTLAITNLKRYKCSRFLNENFELIRAIFTLPALIDHLFLHRFSDKFNVVS